MDKTNKSRRKEESFEDKVDKESDIRFTKTSFIDKFYQRYLENSENRIIRVWEGIIKKRDRTGVGYNRAELAKNEAIRPLLNELCQLDKSY